VNIRIRTLIVAIAMYCFCAGVLSLMTTKKLPVFSSIPEAMEALDGEYLGTAKGAEVDLLVYIDHQDGVPTCAFCEKVDGGYKINKVGLFDVLCQNALGRHAIQVIAAPGQQDHFCFLSGVFFDLLDPDVSDVTVSDNLGSSFEVHLVHQEQADTGITRTIGFAYLENWTEHGYEVTIQDETDSSGTFRIEK